MSTKIRDTVTKGLLAGYGGNAQSATVNRGGFDLKSSLFESEGIVYVDQWLPRDTGGGQELVRVDGEEFTRLYAGGVTSPEKLSELGITGKDIIGYLIQCIISLGAKTRLFEDCKPDQSGEWEYSYQIVEQEEEAGVRVAKEIINYKNQLVFVHYFLLADVK